MDIKKLTILHSNDMHGDFLAEKLDEKLTGGVSQLAWYINHVRKTEPNTIYVISGDMFQGSIIDSEYKGVSTIDMVNALQPDVVALGNHEFDYGLAHLLFLERCANFPIINANLQIRNSSNRLFSTHQILDVNGINILLTGIITEEILNYKSDELISTFIDVNEAAQEIERICNLYKSVDIDLTVVLTHIGHDEDKKLAQAIKPELGVDIIIGGHSHTFLEKPDEVNGILIAQAGVGTDFIGRFDLEIDMDNNSVCRYNWQLIPIDSSNMQNDPHMDAILSNYQNKVTDKYSRILGRMKRSLTHPDRFMETEVGNLLADELAERFGVDLFLLGSGSIRKPMLNEIVTLGELKEMCPFQEPAYGYFVDGKTLKSMIENLYSSFTSCEHREFYQYNKGTQVVYHELTGQVLEIKVAGSDIDENRIYAIGLQEYHANNAASIFGIDLPNIPHTKPPRLLASNLFDIYEDCFTQNGLDSSVQGRIVKING